MTHAFALLNAQGSPQIQTVLSVARALQIYVNSVQLDLVHLNECPANVILSLKFRTNRIKNGCKYALQY